MKYRHIIVICFIVLFSIQIVPINSSTYKFLERDSELVSSQDLGISDIPTPPKILRYLDINTDDGNYNIESNNYNLNITYDLMRSYARIASIMFDSLVEYSYTGETRPALATQWVVTNDSKHWTFTLKDDVWFHDGTKFNASAVKFTLDRIIDPNHSAYVSNPVYYYSNIPLESVEILDEYKVTINFNESYSTFISGLASYTSIYSPNSFGGGPNITVPIGTGPYYLDPASSNKTFQRFLRNNQYFRGFPPFEEIHYIPYGYWEDLKSDVELNKGDFTPRGIYEGGDFIEDYWEYYEAEYCSEIGFLYQFKPELKDPRVRKAINYAINREQYIEYTKFDANIKGLKPLTSVIGSEFPYSQESIPGYPYNVQLANEILDNAGYLRDVDGYRFNLTLNSLFKYKLDHISSYLEAIGIRTIIPNNNSYYYPTDIYIHLHVPHQYYLKETWHSLGKFNSWNYSNPLMDYYLEKAYMTPVRQEQEYYFYNIQQVAQDDPPLLLLQEGKRPIMRAKHVGPFIGVNKIGAIKFNYSIEIEEEDIYYMKDVHISEDPIYFPFTDGLVTLEDQQIEGNMTMTHKLKNLIPEQQETGKFYKLQFNNSESEYKIRCYYDLDEVFYSNPLDIQEVFQWNYSTQSWNKLELIATNTTLRFSEVRLMGDVILRISIPDLLMLTFRFLPIILIIIIPIIGLSVLIINKNRKLVKKIKEEYDKSLHLE